MISKYLNYLWRFWLIILGATLTLLCFVPVYVLSFKKSHYKYAYIFIRLWCLGMFYGMGFRYRLIKESKKQIEEGRTYVFIANHTSMIDVLIPCILMPHHPMCYVGKMELVKIPIFGTIYKRICVMVDRSSSKSRAEVYTRCAERMAEGQSIVIFPEGGVPDDTSIMLDAFKDGAFTLSATHNAPILVFTFAGFKEMFPFDNSKGHPGCGKIFFNGILEPSANIQEAKNQARETIRKTLESYYRSK